VGGPLGLKLMGRELGLLSRELMLLGLAVVEELGLSLEEEKSRAGCLDWRSLTNLGSR
jgi:hypothetical protein